MSRPPFKLPSPLKIYQGATLDQLYTWKAGPDRQSLTPVDLTGCTARMQIRSRVESHEVLMSFSTDDGSIVLGGTAGTVQLKKTDEETSAITWSKGVFDIKVEFSDGSDTRFLQGDVEVSKGVTRVV